MSALPPFIKGLELSSLYYREAVKPVLDRYFPNLVYSAGRLDFGSDVLGYDTPMSRDHDWGPRLMLFLTDEEFEQKREPILRCLSKHLPVEIHGYPAHFIHFFSDGAWMKAVEKGPISPYIHITSAEHFFLGYTGLDINRPMTAADWLVIPWQRLATIASGRIFYDGLERLKGLQSQLRWYPQDVWLYTLTAQWRHIDQEEPFMGRTADVGDELGSRILTSRLVQHLMELCFLMEKHWPPYSKWFGTAFSKLSCAAELQPLLLQITEASDWKSREEILSMVYIHICHIHNKAGTTGYIEPEISLFHSRPYRVPHSNRFVEAIQAAIHSEEVLALPKYVGNINQFVHNIDVLEAIPLCQQLKTIYQTPIERSYPDPGWLIDPLSLPEEEP